MIINNKKIKLLTGIQSTGIPHLGNLFSVIFPTIYLIDQELYSSFIFIADLHSFTNIKDPDLLKLNTYKVAATWLASGLNINKTIFYRQSDIPEITELYWYFNCLYPYKRLKLVHSFKNKKKDFNNGIFTYPILMAADILLYNAEIIPIGKDQLQHIEITRKIAQYFNNQIKKIFILPKEKIIEKFMSIPGTDGKKMSKSKKNIIDIFADNKIIKKQIMNIKTSNLKLEESKNPDTDIIFNIYKILGNNQQIDEMKKKYISGNYGYKEAKTELYNFIIENFSKIREKFHYYMQNIDFLNDILNKGADQAREIAYLRINEIRSAIGFKKKKINFIKK